MSGHTSPLSSPASPTSGMKRRRHSPSLSLDLSDLPPLTSPSAPSNTLIITNLSDPAIFAAPNLQTIRDAIAAQAPLHSFAPLKSFRRIICSFWTIDEATTIRTLLDGETFLGHRARVYFGEPTPVDQEKDRHLAAPQVQKLFFISPPPSPPVGWAVRNEDPPNKDVHADDLAQALHKLSHRGGDDVPPTPTSAGGPRRSRSGTVVFEPGHEGLPAIAVEDVSDDEMLEGGGQIMAHTARPPVELM